MTNIRIPRNFALHAIPLCIDEMSQKSLNVFQVVYFLYSEDNKSIPSTCVSVFQMPIQTTKEVSRQAYVVQFFIPIERIDPRITFHDLSETFSKYGIVEYLTWQTGGHSLY